jgi:hypothetical protein
MLDLFSITRWKWSKEQYTEAIHSGEKHERVYFLEKN